MLVYISILILQLSVISFLLFLVSRVYSRKIATFSIIAAFASTFAVSYIAYDYSGYPQESKYFSSDWKLHHYIADDKNHSFYLMIQETKNPPRIIKYTIKNKEKFEKQKSVLKGAHSSSQDGFAIRGRFNQETDEFVFYEFNMAVEDPK